jgi:hypothetical protein
MRVGFPLQGGSFPLHDFIQIPFNRISDGKVFLGGTFM